MNILVIGDIVGKPGRNAVKDLLPKLIEEHNIEFTIANGENAAGGNGITPKTAEELFSYKVDVITTGDHIWKNKEIQKVIDQETRILRPANYPLNTPGKGYNIYYTHTGNKLCVINLLGRVFLSTLDCPFRTVSHILTQVTHITPNIIVDLHAEATSEKIAMGWYVDGKVSCVFGTHTHVPTRDNRILPGGTAYITDIGMVGSIDSVIGVDRDAVIKRFLTQMPVRFEPARDNIWLYGAVVRIDPSTGKAVEIYPVSERWR